MQLTPEPLRATTDDGLELSVLRIAGPEPARGPVILQHGLGSNRAVFVAPGLGFAEHLAALGYECYVTELRGAGQSERPSGGWSIDDYLELDIPALIATVQRRSGRTQLSWVGHSMGGILAWMYAIEHPDAPIARVAAVGSALDYRPGKSAHQQLKSLLPLARVIGTVPVGRLFAAGSVIAGRGWATPAESLNFWRSNIDAGRMKWVMRHGFEPIPAALLGALGQTFDEEGFRRTPRAGGGAQIRYLERASGLRIPTLVLGGSRDAQCPPQATEDTAQRIGGAVVDHVVFGKGHGHGDDYGHFDLLIGDRAPDEVWPHITRFLEADLEALRA